MAGTANPRDPSRQSAKPRCCSPPARMRAHLDGVSDSDLAVSVRANLDSALGRWRPLARAMDFRNAWWLNATGGRTSTVEVEELGLFELGSETEVEALDRLGGVERGAQQPELLGWRGECRPG